MNRILLLFSALLFSVMCSAQVYDIVVAKDGTGNYTTIQAALDAAPTGSTRTSIFVKKGVYEEKLFIGTRYTEVTNKIISLIGENPDSVIVTWSDYNGKKITYPGKDSITADGTTCPTFTVTAPDFYMENMTICNPSTTAQAVALYQTGDRQTLKNCRLLGNQDTHRTKKTKRFFYYKSTVEGGVDFIYAGGAAYFYQCQINSNRAGYITAPEDITYTATLSSGKTLRYGFFFKDCDLTANASVAAGSVYLGRPWGSTCGSNFLNCRLGSHIHAAGWSDMSGNSATACFFEYQSMNAAGTALADVSGRVSWSNQLTTADVNSYALLQKIYQAISTATTFDPVSLVIAPAPISVVARNGQTLTWDAVTGAKGYVIYANGSAIGFSTTGSYTDAETRATTPAYTVQTVGAHGNLSLPDGAVDLVTAESINAAVNAEISGVSSPSVSAPAPLVLNGFLQFAQPTDFTLFSLSGQALMACRQLKICNLNALPQGTYLISATDAVNGSYHTKIIR
jgi:pectinesterase